MNWEKIAEFFKLEAVAGYIVGFISITCSVALVLYKDWRSKQGRHVVCAIEQQEFSHLQLSNTAREWVTVEFSDEDQVHPVQIATLSQVIIDIKNDSETDTLNNVSLEVSIPEAKVLRVWWEEAPADLISESKLDFSPKGRSSEERQESIDPNSKAQISLAQLKSWKKYKQPVRVGILADGKLGSISMPSQGSRSGVPQDQVWTATFVPFSEIQKRKALKASAIWLFWMIALCCFLVLLGYGSYLLMSDSNQELTTGKIIFVVGFALGSLAFSIFGFVTQHIQAARLQAGSTSKGK